jgi:hypothetical protein
MGPFRTAKILPSRNFREKTSEKVRLIAGISPLASGTRGGWCGNSRGASLDVYEGCNSLGGGRTKVGSMSSESGIDRGGGLERLPVRAERGSWEVVSSSSSSGSGLESGIRGRIAFFLGDPESRRGFVIIGLPVFEQ